MECGVDVVWTGPADVHLGIGADDMVVSQQVAETQFLDALALGAHR
jgi:2-keto-3-deoxy-L-rhamnonate aldolase RhmA